MSQRLNTVVTSICFNNRSTTFYIRDKYGGERIMCPEFNEKTCSIAGVESESLGCSDVYYCRSNEWEKCKVYISQFFLDPDEGMVKAE